MNDQAFDSFEELVAQMQRDAAKVMKEDVAPYVESVLKQHIKDDIYGVYQPKNGGWVRGSTYERRGELADKVVSLFPSEDELIVTSAENANDSVVPGYVFSNRYEGSFLELLASGNMGIWRNGFSRPAVEIAQMDIDTSPDLDRIIAKGIKRVMGDVVIID